MKTTKKIFAVMFAVLMLTGCMKINYHMDVTDNGEVKFEAIVALPNDWEEQMKQFGDLGSEGDEDTDLDNGITTESNMNSNVNTNTNTTPDTNSNSVEEDPFADMDSSLDEEALKKRGFTVEPYEEDDMSGYKVTKTYQLSEVSSDSEVIVNLDQYLADDFDDSKLFQKVSEDDKSTTYRAHFLFDASTDSTDDTEIDLSAFASMFDLGYSITLPNGAISSNATTTEGNTLTWEFTYGTKNEVNFEFKIAKQAASTADATKSSKKGLDTTTIIVIAVVAVAVLVAVGGVIVLVKKKGNKKKNAMMNQTVVNPQGQVPQQPMPGQVQPTVPQQPMTPPTPVVPQQPVVQPTPVVPQQPEVQSQSPVEPQVQAPVTSDSAPTPQESDDTKTNDQQ